MGRDVTGLYLGILPWSSESMKIIYASFFSGGLRFVCDQYGFEDVK